MAKIEWIEYRLLNWARWKLCSGGGALGFAQVVLENLPNAGRSGYIEAAIPISDVEAHETDDCINRLAPPGLALTIHAVYAGHGGIKDKARRLCVAEATVHARVEQAHRQLSAMLCDKQCARDLERQRVEALQHAEKVNRMSISHRE